MGKSRNEEKPTCLKEQTENEPEEQIDDPQEEQTDNPSGEQTDYQQEQADAMQVEQTDVKKELETHDESEQTDHAEVMETDIAGENLTDSKKNEIYASLENEGWTKIGTLRSIYIYPLDTGKGFQLNEAYCSYNGICSYIGDENSLVKPFSDRSLVAYSPGAMSAVSLDERLGVSFTLEELVDAQIVSRAANIEKKKVKISYLGSQIEVTETPFSILVPRPITHFTEEVLQGDVPLSSAYQLFHDDDVNHDEIDKYDSKKKWSHLFKVGYFSLSDRDEFNIEVRSTLEEPMCVFQGFYYAYTFINSKSLDVIKKEYANCRFPKHDLEFRPQLVIEAIKPYIEDNIKYMRIGPEVSFGNLLPCTHSLLSFDYPRSVIYRKQLFSALKSTRLIGTVCPYLYDSSLPVFGCNVDAVEDGVIKVNDPVYVKFSHQS